MNAVLVVAFLALGQIQGPARAEPASLVVLTASPADQSAWFAVGDGVDLAEAENGAKAFLVSRKPGPVTILLFQARLGVGDRLEVAQYAHVIQFGPAPAPAPLPEDPFRASVRQAALKLAPEVAQQVARNYRQGAAEIAKAAALAEPSPWKSLVGIQDSMRSLNRSNLPGDAPTTAFFAELAKLIREQAPADPAAVAELWRAIAEALEGTPR